MHRFRQPMKYCVTFLLLSLTALHAGEPRTLLALPGKVIYESKLDTAPAAPWRAAKGKWELADGAWRG
ncbi:MAG: hypothetical protein LDL31_10740, partial [Prosthecobacter sp.]|nr:hypothetical protein [Prosthecobacter sp.]